MARAAAMGAPVSAARNKTSFEWSAAKGGTLKELEQKMAVRRGRDRQGVEAKFRAERNETTLRLHEPEAERKVVRPGLLLLGMATERGNLGI